MKSADTLDELVAVILSLEDRRAQLSDAFAFGKWVADLHALLQRVQQHPRNGLPIPCMLELAMVVQRHAVGNPGIREDPQVAEILKFLEETSGSASSDNEDDAEAMDSVKELLGVAGDVNQDTEDLRNGERAGTSTIAIIEREEHHAKVEETISLIDTHRITQGIGIASSMDDRAPETPSAAIIKENNTVTTHGEPHSISERVHEEENWETAWETIMANDLSRVAAQEPAAIEEDEGGPLPLMSLTEFRRHYDEKEPASAQEKTKVDVTENTDFKSYRGERMSRKVRKPKRFRDNALAEVAANDSSTDREGSAALIEDISAGVHLSQGKLPLMDRREYHERFRNNDRVLAWLAKAQPNKIKCKACQKAQEFALCALDAARRGTTCLRCRISHLSQCTVMKSPANRVDDHALQLPAMEPVAKRNTATILVNKKRTRLDSEVERPQPNKKARLAQKATSVRESKGAKASSTASDTLDVEQLMSKKLFEWYVAFRDDEIKTLLSQLQAARQILDDFEDGVTRLRRVTRHVARAEIGVVKAEEATEGAAGRSAFSNGYLRTNAWRR
ncbi:hypothetical protein AX14_000612 [Amanita brunnescens Koide BX004]|nr:hypothetical protein AX14_000612 [Amanita brunnescens Koide BX004]